MVAYNSRTIDLFNLLRNEEIGQLEKIAKYYDGNGNISYEKITFPKSEVGEVALLRAYAYDGVPKLIGLNVSISTWLQADEDLANPPLTDITLSDEEVDVNDPAGSVVATITAVGGSPPVTFTLTDDAGGKLKIANGNELQMNATALLGESPYNITIRATDSMGNIFDKAFAITVVGFVNSKSLDFDGINDSLNFGDKFLYDHTNQWSLSVWIKPDNSASRQTIYAKATNDANVYGWSIYFETGNKTFIQVRTASTLRSYTGALTYNVGAWNHFVMTYNGGSNLNGMRVYVNGAVDSTPGSQSLAGTLLLNQDARFAARNTAFLFTGNMDEGTIWDKELTSGEVTELYNAGVPADPTLHSANANLQHWYRFGDGDTFPTITDQVGTDDGTMLNMDAGDIETDVP